jgi:endothelin-converting enzyme
MKKSTSLFSLIPVCVLAGCAGGPSSPESAAAEASPQQSGVFIQNMDKAVRAQDDFYRFVNGRWLAVTEIPSDRSNYGAFTLLQEDAEHNLRQILEESAAANAPKGSETQKVGDFYASFMDEAAIEAAGIRPLVGERACTHREARH